MEQTLPPTGNTEQTAPENNAFYPALDGLRAVAVGAVFVYHLAYALRPAWSSTAWGWAGVDLFFVISGFLITGILLDTVSKEHYFQAFYVRRTLRIFPLFYGMWLLAFLATPFLHLGWTRWNMSYLFYAGNLTRGLLFHTQHRYEDVVSGFFAIVSSRHTFILILLPLWSLCVEEQFYLVWPAVLWLTRSRRKLFVICVAGIVFEPIFRELVWHFFVSSRSHLLIYTNTFARFDPLLVGAIIALWVRNSTAWKRTPHWFPALMIFVPLAILAMLIHKFSAPGTDFINEHITVTIGFSLIACAAAGLLLLAIRPGTMLSRALSLRPLRSVGRVSYGIYVIHTVFFFMLVTAPRHWLVSHHLEWPYICVLPFFIYGLAWLSFRYYETPFLRLKTRFLP